MSEAFSLWRGEVQLPAPKVSARSSQAILTDVAAQHGMSVKDLLSKARQTRFIRARWDAMHMLRETPKLSGGKRSLSEIGRLMGGMDHTSISHGLQRREAELAAKPDAKREAEAA